MTPSLGIKMLAPNAEQIESAVDNLKVGTTEVLSSYPTLSDFIHDSQLKELHSALGENISEDFVEGYMLGLQTARIVLLQSVKLMLAKINPIDIL